MNNDGNYKEVIVRLEALHELINTKFEANNKFMATKFETNEIEHSRIIGRMDIANNRTNKCESKISILENWRWYIIGIITILMFLVNLFSSEVVKIIK